MSITGAGSAMHGADATEVAARQGATIRKRFHMVKYAPSVLAVLATGALWTIADGVRTANAQLYEIRLHTLDLKNAAWAIARK